MICPKCKSPMLEDSLFCSSCGASLKAEESAPVQKEEVNDDIDRTMAIPVIRTRPEPESKPSVRRVEKSAESEKKEKNSDKKVKVISFAVSFVCTVLILFLITLGVIFISNGSKENPLPAGEETAQKEEAKKNDKKTPSKKDAEDGESIGVDTNARIKIDTEFDFALGETLSSSALEYTTVKNTKYGYKCDVPSSFVSAEGEDGETRYKASDDTAYMDIGAFQNTMELEMDDIKEMISDALSKDVEYENGGDGWFITVTEKNSVVYFLKCYVDEDYVKYMEFVYPEQYSETYDVFVDDIEETFESTK